MADNRTGAIWRKAPRSRAQVVRRVAEQLQRAYGIPRLHNPTDPLDDLIFIILSNKASPSLAISTYGAVKTAFPSWSDILASDPSVLTSLLVPAGLARIKSQQIRSALHKIAQDLGSCSLVPLIDRNQAQVLAYLLQLSGVSQKVAKCVMMYTMGARVLPVDAHMHRITGRLGWTRRNRPDQCHSELEALVPPSRRYGFHVDCIAHGRAVCRPAKPACSNCCVRRHCDYYSNLKSAP